MTDTHFIDPRGNPAPPVARPGSRLTRDWEAVDRLRQLCRFGCMYDVERWIAEGRPLQVDVADMPRRGRRRQTALEVALEAGNQALVLLLLVNGYDPNQEEGSPLDQALSDRRWDLLDLLLDWGADPKDVDLETLLGTYRTSLIERFRSLGVNLTADHAMASALGYHTSNKPLFGFARRHRADDPSIQRELNTALRHHAGEGNEKGVMLCLWAGADPHAFAPSLRYDIRPIGDDDEEEDDSSGVSAVWQACCSGQHEILRRLEPDPELDDFDSLYYAARNSATMRILMDIAPPRRPGAVICSLIRDVSWRSSLAWGYYGTGHYETVRAIETLFEGGIRWHVAEGEEAAAVRATLDQAP